MVAKNYDVVLSGSFLSNDFLVTSESFVFKRVEEINKYLKENKKEFTGLINAGVIELSLLDEKERMSFIEKLNPYLNETIQPDEDIDKINIHLSFRTDYIEFSVKNHGKEFFPFLTYKLELEDVILENFRLGTYKRGRSILKKEFYLEELSNVLRIGSEMITYSLVSNEVSLSFPERKDRTIIDCITESLYKRYNNDAPYFSNSGLIKIYSSPFTVTKRGVTSFASPNNMTKHLTEGFLKLLKPKKKISDNTEYSLHAEKFIKDEGFLCKVKRILENEEESIPVAIPMERIYGSDESFHVRVNDDEVVIFKIDFIRGEISRFLKREFESYYKYSGIKKNSFKVIDGNQNIPPVIIRKNYTMSSDPNVNIFRYTFTIASCTDIEKTKFFVNKLKETCVFSLFRTQNDKETLLLRVNLNEDDINIKTIEDTNYIEISFIDKEELMDCLVDGYKSVNLNLIYSNDYIIGSGGIDFHSKNTLL